MMTKEKFSLNVYFQNKDYKVGEMDNAHLLTVLKYITQKDYKGALASINTLITPEPENFVHALYLLCHMRAISIGGEISWSSGNGIARTDGLEVLIDSISKLPTHKKVRVSEGHYKKDIYIDIPTGPVYDAEDLVYNCIREIKNYNIHGTAFSVPYVGESRFNQEYQIDNFTRFEYSEVLKVVKNIERLYSNINILPDVPFDIFSEKFWQFMLETFAGIDLQGYYNLLFTMTKKLGYSGEYFNTLTYNETKVIISMYNEYIEQLNSQQTK